MYNNLEIDCNYNSIPNTTIVDTNQLSYLKLSKENLTIQASVLIPKSHKMIPEFAGLSQTEYNQNQKLNKKEEKTLKFMSGYQKQQQKRYDYVNSFVFLETQTVSTGISRDQQIQSIQVLVFGNDDAVKFIDVFYLKDINQQDCNYGIQLNTVLSPSQAYWIKFYHFNNSQLILVIYQNQKSIYSNQYLAQLLLFKQEQSNTEINIYKAFQDYNISKIKQENTQEPLINFNQVFVKKYDQKGNQNDDYIFEVEDQKNPLDFIPKVVVGNQQLYYNYEFINQNNILKFYQLEVNKLIGVQYKTIGFHIQIDYKNIQTFAIKDLQQQNQVFYFSEQQHGILGFNELERVEVTYQFFQDNFATISRHQFNPQIQNGIIIDQHLLFHEYSLQSSDDNGQIDYQLLVAYKYDQNVVEIHIQLGEKKIVNRKKKWLIKRKNYQINQQKFSYVNYVNQEQIDYTSQLDLYQINYFQKQIQNMLQNTSVIQSLKQQSPQVKEGLNTNFSSIKGNNLKLEPLDKSNQDDMEEDYNFSVEFNKNEVHFQIINFEDKFENLKCRVPSIYEPETLSNIQNLKINVLIFNKKNINLKVKLSENTNEKLIFDVGVFDFDLIIQENNLLNSFCYTIIKQNAVVLVFSALQNGYILQEKMYEKKQQKQVTIRTNLYLIKNSQIQFQKFDQSEIIDSSINDLNRHSILLEESGIYTNISTQSYKFQDFLKTDQKSFEQPLTNVNEIQNDLNIYLHSFVLQTQEYQKTLITKLGLYIQPQNHQVIYILQNNYSNALIFQYKFLKTHSQMVKQIYLDNIRNYNFQIVQQGYDNQTFDNLQPLTVLFRNQDLNFTFTIGKNQIQKYYLYIYNKNEVNETYILNIFYERQQSNNMFSCMSAQTYEDPNSYIVQLVQINQLEQPMLPFQQLGDDKSYKLLMKTNKKLINQNTINLEIGYNETSSKNKPNEFQIVTDIELDFQALDNFYTKIIQIPNINLKKLKTIVNQVTINNQTPNTLQAKLIFNAYKKLIVLI